MHRDVEAFIERAGLLWQKDGLPRIAGRIFALALVSPEPCSLDDIAESLGVSKASVSNDARMLEQLGMIERVSIAGDRKDYYQINDQSLERAIEMRVQRIEEFRQLLEKGMELPIRHTDVRERIADHRVAFGYLSNALSEALTEIKERHAAPRSRKS